ncbi:tautomerase family protein [Salidesulfovibrio onnuriiensis]|uniref:tautomerase family protein n=1 Tax=Salidesulfovibrio onnuriiensis TaxID=2583823 RepID=UPI0011C722F5|nr:tautomerase family protein [Salidesulfovibrio onnuriiensis]
MPILTVKTWAGISEDQKRDMVETFTRESCRILDCKQEHVMVVIEEVDRANWGLEGGLAKDLYPKKE